MLSKPHLSFTAGFGTLPETQVAGLHRAVPSTTLDKVFNFQMHYNRIFAFVNRKSQFCKQVFYGSPVSGGRPKGCALCGRNCMPSPQFMFPPKPSL